MNREDAIGERLRDAGLRRTPVRLAVLGRLTAARRPLAAPELIRELGDAAADEGTVYRTLNTLAEHKLAHRVRGEDGAWRYAAAAAPGGAGHEDHPHAHFVCDRCGTVECLEEVPVPDELMRPRSLGRRYDVTHAELVVHGTCPKCHV